MIGVNGNTDVGTVGILVLGGSKIGNGVINCEMTAGGRNIGVVVAGVVVVAIGGTKIMSADGGAGVVVISEAGVVLINEAGVVVITGVGVVVIIGAGVVVITGAGVMVINEAGVVVITGAGVVVITEAGVVVITGAGVMLITEAGVAVITGAGVVLITGAGVAVITGARVTTGEFETIGADVTVIGIVGVEPMVIGGKDTPPALAEDEIVIILDADGLIAETGVVPGDSVSFTTIGGRVEAAIFKMVDPTSLVRDQLVFFFKSNLYSAPHFQDYSIYNLPLLITYIKNHGHIFL